jgi:cyanophycinase-like exopeptidase
VRFVPLHRPFALAICGLIVSACAGGPSAPLPSRIPAAARRASGAVAGRGCRPVFYTPRGASKPGNLKPQGPGLVLGGGGTDVDAEFVWIHDTIAGSPIKRGGDLVVLRSTGNNAYDRYIYRLAPYHSVRTLLLPTCAPPKILAEAAAIVAKSTAVFFAGGNQADYVIWKNTPLQTAVQGVYDRGGVVGGTSAGEAILGDDVFDAVAEGNRDTTTDNAVHDPYERLITFTYDFLKFPVLRDVITDQHFASRNRFGRTSVFMARQLADGRVHRRVPIVRAVAVDEASGLVIDKRGIGTLLLQYRGGGAFLIRGGAATQIEPGMPFVSGRLTVTKLRQNGDTFDFNRWCGNEPTYDVTVDGTEPNPLMYDPKNPYKPPAGSRIPHCR